MSIQRNVIASYTSQLYVTLVGILMVPMYVRYMGTEAYGLVGFFAMLQAWFQLLDMGLTPTLTRETARFNGGATDALSLRRLLRALECIFIGLGCVGAAIVIASAPAIASQWLQVEHLPLHEVSHAIMLMAPIVALRWVSGLYRGTVSGFERLVWLSGFNALIASLRFVAVLPYLMWVGAAPADFFQFQLAVAVVEVLVLVACTYRLLPPRPAVAGPWQWRPLRAVLGFSLSIAFTGSVWVLVTQTDKLVLSKLLPLSAYALFTLAVLVASGVMVVSAPISAALLPRLARLAAEGKEGALVGLYRDATQVVAVIALPAALVLAAFAEPVLWVWTGDAAIARSAAPVLSLYALGNGVLALAAFPYYLQFAKGDLKLHLIGNLLFVLVLIPALVWATWRHGMIGAGVAWLSANMLYFLAWIPAVHGRFFTGLHGKWLGQDVAPVAGAAALAAGLARSTIDWPAGRFAGLVLIGAISVAVLLAAASASSTVRAALRTRLHTHLRPKENDA